MLPNYLIEFNGLLFAFQAKFPRDNWTAKFKNDLINDYTFYSSRVEDSKLEYGDTIKFLNNETVRGVNLRSLSAVSEHQFVLNNLIDNINDFDWTEKSILSIHKNLMDSPLAWENDFRPELVGHYRNVPVVGSRQPLFENKEYAPHYNLSVVVPSWLEIFKNQFGHIDNSINEKHLLTRVAFFHNKFLNEIHPFADGNGRVCRIIIGALLMVNNCPPIFPEIISQEQQIEYITTIVDCERDNNNEELIKFLANGMNNYLRMRIES